MLEVDGRPIFLDEGWASPRPRANGISQKRGQSKGCVTLYSLGGGPGPGPLGSITWQVGTEKYQGRDNGGSEALTATTREPPAAPEN